MIPYQSLEQAQQSGAQQIFLDSRTQRFWAARSETEARAAERLGLVRASEWPVTQALELDEAPPVIEALIPAREPVSSLFIWAVVIGLFLLNVACYGVVAWWKGGAR